MAQFEGTIKEFTKFIGPYARIKVAFISAKYKKQVGKCEDCGNPKSLDAAHIKGKGRSLLIANILSEFIDEDIVRLDLNEFEERYVDAHLPIESTIRVLCKECHRKYDRIVKDKAAIETISIAEESVIIEDLVKNQMNKSKTIKLAAGKNLSSLTSSNTIFSNIIVAHDGWWLEPHNDKLKTLLHMVLHDDRSRRLYIIRLSANTITNPASHFKQRNDKYRVNCSDIYIATSGTRFVEKNGFDFTNYLFSTMEY